MANDVQRIFQRCYVQLQSVFDTIPNTSGTATLTGSDCCMIISLDTDASQAEIPRPDKTGSYDEVIAQGGRRVGAWSAKMSMAGNGAAGVLPDQKNFIQAGMGHTPVIVASTSCAWALDDTLYYLAIWDFNAPSTATQKVAFNALVNKLEIDFGGDVPTLTLSGESGWVYDSAQAADGTTDPLAKGGLTSFPAEPSTPVVNGTFPPGFKVTSVIDGNTYTTVLTGKITVEVGREVRKDTNSEFPRTGAAGKRMVTHDLEITDDDSAGLTTLKQKTMSRTPINATHTVGTIAGNRWVFQLNNMIMTKPKYGDAGVRRKLTFSGCKAYPSSITAKDQFTILIN